MPKKRSYVTRGRAHYRKTGRYIETTTAATNGFYNDASSAFKQLNLAPKGDKSAAANTVRKARKELQW